MENYLKPFVPIHQVYKATGENTGVVRNVYKRRLAIVVTKREVAHDLPPSKWYGKAYYMPSYAGSVYAIWPWNLVLRALNWYAHCLYKWVLI